MKTQNPLSECARARWTQVFKNVVLLLVIGAMACVTSSAAASPIAFTNADATFTQASFDPSQTIDGDTGGGGGWAIAPAVGVNQTLVVQTVTGQGFAGGSALTFTLSQNFPYPRELLGRFRLSVTTTASPSTSVGTWTQLTPISAFSANGATLTIQGDNSILSSGTIPNQDVYTILANTTMTGITGVRLEALTDASLPSNGPGWQGGNFVLSEIQADIVAAPEPGTVAAMATGVAGLIGMTLLRRKKAGLGI